MQNRWLVIWSHNGCERWEPFEFRMIAEIKMIQLESFGIESKLIDLYTQPELMSLIQTEVQEASKLSVN